MNTEVEIWKEIPGYEGSYMASSLGRIKSLKYNKERILKPIISKRGYYTTGLSVENKPKVFTIHLLLAYTFLGHNPSGSSVVVDHIDNNKLNNNLSNLQLVTSRENTTKDLFRKNHSSKYIGVNYSKERSKWRSNIKFKNKKINLGYFITEQEAHLRYIEALELIKKGIEPKFTRNPKYYNHNKKMNKFICYDIVQGKPKHMGVFKTEQEAIDFVKTYKL